MGRIAEHILHVDMDAFFVEVERRRDRSLGGAPVVVGGLGPRGVVASASYEARRGGVRSAMPMVEARRRLPGGHFLPPDHVAYREASAEVHAIFGAYTPVVEAVSIDEAFLDIAGLGLHYRGAAAVASSVRSRLKGELGLPASAGAGTTKLVAKLASERAKPDGQQVVAAGGEAAFLRPLDVRSLWGVGEATYAALEAIGVRTIGELADLPESLLRRRLGATVGPHLWALAHNIDDRQVTPESTARSISVEETFPHDITGEERVADELFRLCSRLGDRLRRAGTAAGTVSVKVRFADFTTVTRSHSVDGPIDLTSDLVEAATILAERAGAGTRPIRLLGVAATGLTSPAHSRQLGLGSERSHALADASDDVRRRFGEGALRPARLVPPPKPRAD